MPQTARDYLKWDLCSKMDWQLSRWHCEMRSMVQANVPSVSSGDRNVTGTKLFPLARLVNWTTLLKQGSNLKFRNPRIRKCYLFAARTTCDTGSDLIRRPKMQTCWLTEWLYAREGGREIERRSKVGDAQERGYEKTREQWLSVERLQVDDGINWLLWWIELLSWAGHRKEAFGSTRPCLSLPLHWLLLYIRQFALNLSLCLSIFTLAPRSPSCRAIKRER